MKTIRIKFCSFWGSFDEENNLFTNILKRHFNVEISDNPDFVICSNRGKPFEYMKYDCVRIMFMGEEISPDFTAFDYCIGFDDIRFGDRYFKFPLAFYADDAQPYKPESLTYEQAVDVLKMKKYFCNWIYRHKSTGMREKLFFEFSKYKRVESPGYLFNNAGNGKIGCSWKEKSTYLQLSKFTIAGESLDYPGYVTEKIVQPFEYHSIPIFWGNPEIDKYFNTNSFVWCKSEDDIERVMAEVKEIDNDDNRYLKMLMESPLVDRNLVVDMYEQLEAFLLNIFSQDRECAFRRLRYFCAAGHEALLKNAMKREARTPQIVKKLREKLKL